MRLLPFVAMVGLLWLSGRAGAESPVYFADLNLKAAVEGVLWTSDPTPDDMLGLTSLPVEAKGITDLTGLEYAKNLEELWIRWNHISDLSPLSGLTSLRLLDAHGNDVISDLSPLSGLTQLETLVLRDNHISDISALSSLTNLRYLYVEWNQISDISALSGMTEMREITIEYNSITDISPLLGLTNLDHIDIRGNPLNGDACTVHIPQIIAANPGINLEHNSCGQHRAVFSSTRGGRITAPGEGEFVYDNGEVIYLKAEADPCFVFAGFSGTYSSTVIAGHLPIEQDHQILASFVSTLDRIHVDDDSPSDPQPDDVAGSDPQEDGSADHPFDRIQEAIDVAADQTIVLVHPGTYRENIDFLGKRIHVIGADLGNSLAPYPTIAGAGPGPVVRFNHGEGPNSRLAGFVITDSKNRSGSAIRCSASSPTIANCLIAGNRRIEPGDAAISCTDSNAVFVNCTIADNYAGEEGAGLLLRDSSVTLVNSILWANMPCEIVSSGEATVSVQYSTVAGGWPGLGNRSSDPLFAGVGRWVDPRNSAIVVGPDRPDAVWVTGDYHIKSRAGRWDPKAGQWLQDAATSPCIDAGDPNAPIGEEPPPNGSRVNLGAYGGTSQASMSTSGY